MSFFVAMLSSLRAAFLSHHVAITLTIPSLLYLLVTTVSFLFTLGRAFVPYINDRAKNEVAVVEVHHPPPPLLQALAAGEVAATDQGDSPKQMTRRANQKEKRRRHRRNRAGARKGQAQTQTQLQATREDLSIWQGVEGLRSNEVGENATRMSQVDEMENSNDIEEGTMSVLAVRAQGSIEVEESAMVLNVVDQKPRYKVSIEDIHAIHDDIVRWMSNQTAAQQVKEVTTAEVSVEDIRALPESPNGQAVNSEEALLEVSQTDSFESSPPTSKNTTPKLEDGENEMFEETAVYMKLREIVDQQSPMSEGQQKANAEALQSEHEETAMLSSPLEEPVPIPEANEEDTITSLETPSTYPSSQTSGSVLSTSEDGSTMMSPSPATDRWQFDFSWADDVEEEEDRPAAERQELPTVGRLSVSQSEHGLATI